MKLWVSDFTSLSLNFLLHETGMMKAMLIHRTAVKQQQEAFLVFSTVVIILEKLALFSLGAFSAHQGHLTGPSGSLSLTLPLTSHLSPDFGLSIFQEDSLMSGSSVIHWMMPRARAGG